MPAARRLYCSSVPDTAAPRSMPTSGWKEPGARRILKSAMTPPGCSVSSPLEGSWKGVSFLNPARDGAVLPILHLNGYKIAGPTVLGRSSDETVRSLLGGHGYDVHFVEGDEPLAVHQAFAKVLDTCYDQIRAIQSDAKSHGVRER